MKKQVQSSTSKEMQLPMCEKKPEAQSSHHRICPNSVLIRRRSCSHNVAIVVRKQVEAVSNCCCHSNPQQQSPTSKASRVNLLVSGASRRLPATFRSLSFSRCCTDRSNFEVTPSTFRLEWRQPDAINIQECARFPPFLELAAQSQGTTGTRWERSRLWNYVSKNQRR